jgi:hypothetical protein
MNIDHQTSSNALQSQHTLKFGNKSYSISDRTIILVIVMMAVGLRLVSALYQGNTVSDLPGVYDQISYDGLARRVIDGFGFSFAEGHWPATRAGEPTAHWSYLYTVYLVVVYKLFGIYPMVARIIQALVAGIFQTLLMYRIGTRLFNGKVGLVAAFLSSIYIYFFYYAGALITETFYITSILWVFDVAFRLMDIQNERNNAGTRSWLVWGEFGLAIGITVLLRQVFLLFLPALYLWLWLYTHKTEAKTWRRKIRWSTLKGLFLTTCTLAVLIAPWTIRNYRAFGTFVLLNTNAGFAFYWGNHPIQGTHFMPLLAGSGSSYQDLIPPDLLVLNEGKLDQVLLQRGIQFVLQDPGRYVLLSISRLEEYFKFWPSKDSGLLSNISRVGSFGVLLPFMLIGLLLSLGKFRRPEFRDHRANLLIIYIFIFVYALIHLLTWTLIRYRLPIDAFLLIFASLSLELLIAKFVPAQRENLNEKSLLSDV